MATKLIGEAIVSGAIQLVLARIASPEVVNYFLGKRDSNFEGLLKRLKIMVSSLTGVLDDAEQRQIRNEPRVEAWLDDVQEAVFEADDLLDDIETDALQRKVEGESKASASEVRETKRQKIFNLFSRSGNLNEEDVEKKMMKLLERLEEIARQKDLLSLKETSQWWQRLPSTSLIDESEVYGRDKDKEAVLKLLMSEDARSEKISVIPIVGMGGVGKTTLAQAVFKHYKVRDKFQLKAWACVSEEYDALRITKTILKSVSHVHYDDAMDLNSIQVKLEERLSGKKFLIVLDDVWNEKYGDWEVMRMPFMDGAQGSKIIVTTRSLVVASIMGTPNIPAHCLNVLTEEASWQLFSKHAFGKVAKNPDLERIGREIMKKCKGLPLAVKTLGGLLSSMSNIDQWEGVLISDIWELTDVQSDILPSLRLSYYYLPSHLKRCFSYCSLFPKDYAFEKENLIFLWMAESLLEQPKGNKSLEEVGDQYFNNLLSRSFFQSRVYNETGKTYFVMHDLIVDLANSVSGKYHYRLDSRSSDDIKVTKETRYLACDGQKIDSKRFNYITVKASHLRTFLLRNLALCFSKEPELGELFLKLKNLRVLSLCYYQGCNNFVHTICKLRHLRFLDLSHSSINNLPSSFCTLYNLQTLKLVGCNFLSELPNDFHQLCSLRYLDASRSRLKVLPDALSRLVNLQKLNLCDCDKLTKLPEGFHDLISLRYLNIRGTELKAMPKQISKLKSLRTLSTFIVGKDPWTKISELGSLSKMIGTLYIKNLQNVVKVEDALEAKLREKYLEVLSFEWENHHKTNDSQLEFRLLASLTPNTSLIRLNIIRYGGDKFPSWVGHQLFCNIVDVFLSHCNDCVTLPPLGQLSSLKKLSINNFKAVVIVGSEFYGSRSSMVKPFASLEELKFSEMRNWKDWMIPNEDVEVFPKLRKLTLESCNSLIGDMPGFLPSLTMLKIHDCQQLASPVPMLSKATSLTLVEAVESYNHLQNLDIQADSLSLQFKCLPSALKTLTIKCLKSLEFQLHEKLHESLEELSLECHCGFSRLSFSLVFFTNIKSVRIYGCDNIVSLWVSPNRLSFESPKSLSTMYIYNCCGSKLFLSELSNLTSFVVSNCKDLKFLPEQMHNLLPSLQSLKIIHCSELESFPLMGLPSSLCDLTIDKCDKLVASRSNWNLQRLTNLTSIKITDIEYEDMESFPESGLLPITVRRIHIQKIGGLRILHSKELQQLIYLKELLIYGCPKLEVITEEGLPATLSYLLITKCPLLKYKCQKDTGEYWNKIAHIPRILIHFRNCV